MSAEPPRPRPPGAQPSPATPPSHSPRPDVRTSDKPAIRLSRPWKRYPKYRDSGVEWLGEIPEGWGVCRLKHLARIGNGSTPQRDNTEYWDPPVVPWMNSGRVNDGVITTGDQYVSTVAFRECHLPLVRSGSLLMAITGEGKTRGSVALLNLPATISQHVAFVSLRSADRCTSVFLRWYLTSLYSWLRRESSGLGSTKAAITCESIGEIPVVLPGLQSQRRIADLIDRETTRLDSLSARIASSIALLREYRTALISAAVTGKIDVREEARPRG